MPSKSVLYVTAALVLGALLINSVVRGHSPEGAAEWLAPIGPAVSLAIAGLVIFDRWAWRQPGIRRLVGRPILRGTWFGEVASTWEDPQTEKRIDPDPSVFLVIRQSFWSVSARLLTNESRSKSIFAALRADEDGVCRLLYVYENHPDDDVKHRSQTHYGTAILSAPQNRHDGVVGGYFTGRKTTGDMRFHQHFPELVESYEAGLKLLRL